MDRDGTSMAVTAWLVYLGVHFILMPAWFACRFRRSPYALHWVPRNGYDLAESAYGLMVVGYTTALLMNLLCEPRWPVAALACHVAGSGFIVWAEVSLGGNWRIGQDEGDAACSY